MDIKIKTVEVSDASVNAGISFGVAFKFIAICIGVCFVLIRISEAIGMNDLQKSIFCTAGLVMFIFFMLMSMTKNEARLSTKRKIQSLESEIQSLQSKEKLLNEKEQSLLLDIQLLQKNERLSKLDNDRLWQKVRLLEDELTAEKSKATADIETAKNGLIPIQKQLIDAQKRLSAIETAIRIEGEVGSLNGRQSKATGEEKELIERLKLEERSKMTEHLKHNHWLLTLKPSWGGVKI